jgi:DNA-binding SARP family transcriptional activator/TolB-like protein
MVRLQVLGSLGLTGDDGREIRPLLAQPKRLGLFLYLLLAEPRGFVRRDALVALFWPELAAEAARAALRRALHFLRSNLGDGVIVSRGEEEVGVAVERIACDALEFESHLAAGRDADALAVYHGDLFAGVFVSDAAPDLDEWIDAARRRYRERAGEAAGRLSEREDQAGQSSTARFWARRALDLAPHSETALVRALRQLDQAGERAAALELYDTFARRLQGDLGVEPGPEARALHQSLRARRPTPAAVPVTPARSPATAAPPPVIPFPPSPHRASGWRRTATAAGLLVLVATVAAVLSRRGSPRSAVLAVGAVGAPGTAVGDSADVATALPQLLATGLGDLADLQVISRGRLYELSGELGARGPSAAALMQAANRAGANRLVEGEVFRQADGWRLDLRLVELPAGTVLHSYVLRARDLFALADSATERLAGTLRRDLPPAAARAAELGPRSLVARRYFDDGLRAYYRREYTAADALFGLALSEDTTFALALYYAARTRGQLGTPITEVRAIARRARAAAEHSGQYERLLIGTYWALADQNPTAVALADSLVAAYPLEPEGYLLAGDAHWLAADFPGELRVYRRLLQLDSLAPAGATAAAECRPCLALQGMSAAYLALDSLPEALPLLRQVQRLRPSDHDAWATQIFILTTLGRSQEALDILANRADSVHATAMDVTTQRALMALLRGDFAEASRHIAVLRGLPGLTRQYGYWLQNLSDRMQGREALALASARRYETEGLSDPDVVSLGTGPLLRAQVLFESGRPREAAALFDTLRLHWRLTDTTSGAGARQHAWMLAHEVTALAAAGDTARVAVFVDTLEAVGRRVAYVRDQRMHHYARGLLWDARGRPADAIAEYRQALTSPTIGYTRISYRLAADLLAQGHPADAVRLLRGALHGGLEASNLYVTHTELRELLARAFDAAGQRDSAAVQYQRVAAAWRGADAPYGARGRSAAERAAALAR